MTVLETVLVFAGIPLGLAGLVVVLVYGANARRYPRYRPGRPFNVTPVWFLAAPPGSQPESSGRPALTAGPATSRERPVAAEPTGPKGGARGSW